MNIDWKTKLSSRRLWAMVAGLVTSIVLLFQGDPTSTIGGCVMGGGSIVAYILGESWGDAADRASNTTATTISASTNAKEVVENAMKTKE